MVRAQTIPIDSRTPALAIGEFWRELRVAEKVVTVFFAGAVMAALVVPMSLHDRFLVSLLSLGTVAAVLLLAAGAGSRRWIAAARDWFPTVVILVAYRESGLFLRPDPAHRLDFVFAQWDRALLHNLWVEGLIAATSPWLPRYLELAYLLCYPLVPLGLAALVLATSGSTISSHHAPASTSPLPPGEGSRLRARPRAYSEGAAAWEPTGYAQAGNRAIDRFWTSVLLATLSCYAIYPLFPLTPPRILFHDLPWPALAPLLRKMNFWILNEYSVQACIFPSGHVAAVTATALAVRAYLPRLGVAFLVAAASVAVATVLGRYHYSPDAVAGALVGIAAFLLAHVISRR